MKQPTRTYAPFSELRKRLEKQYECVEYDESSGLPPEEIQALFQAFLAENPQASILEKRAELFSLLCRHARIAPEKDFRFAGKFQTGNLITAFRDETARKVWAESCADLPGFFYVTEWDWGIRYMIDTSHVAPDWHAVLRLGLPGLRNRAAAGHSDFHKAAVKELDGAMLLAERIGKASENEDLLFVSAHAPETLSQAFQLAYFLHDLLEIEGEEIRTMGRLDHLYWPFYERDLERGILTRESAGELIRHFFLAFYAKYQGKRFGKNFCFGPDVNDLSFLAMEIYEELNLPDPKISIRTSPETPDDFLRLCMRCIRNGRNGIVFLNDPVVLEGMIRHGRTPEDAADYIPIGCYEPAVLGKEVSLSAATWLMLPHVLLRTLRTHESFECFEDLFRAFLQDLEEAAKRLAARQARCEKAWPEIAPVPLLSSTFAECVERGLDITSGGAKYNTTGNVLAFLGDCVDSLTAIRYLVFETKKCSFAELKQILDRNWEGSELLRREVLAKAPKWGNNDDAADSLAVRISNFIAPILASLPNGRGGTIYPSIYGQLVVEFGAKTPAFPSGRLAGEVLSKNLDAAIGMDRRGITALMNSALKLDYRKFPCGACLDLMLHPSSVTGEDGLDILLAVTRTYLARGGTGLQFNLFDAEMLKDAQRHPEKYETLQVRVCGWNARFNDLSVESQNTFIRQAEAM